MKSRDGDVVGWILAVIALFVLATDGNIGMLLLLVPVSFLLACVMIGPACGSQVSDRNSGKPVVAGLR